MSEINNEMELGNDILSLVDEEGNEHTFEVVDTYDDDNDNTYLALVPVHEEDEEVEGSDELIILKTVLDENNEECLEPIDNEEEFNKLAEIFMKRLSEEFDFLDSEEE